MALKNTLCFLCACLLCVGVGCAQIKLSMSPETPQSRIKFSVGKSSFDMVYVKGGLTILGSNDVSVGDADERPTHRVMLDDFYIGRFEVTQDLWESVMGDNPSNFKGDDLPVEQVSYYDVIEFISRLNRMTGVTFRLPTEAEWEYAAMGGVDAFGYTYAGGDGSDWVAWYMGNSAHRTHPVGMLSPNALGLYDMTGNVWEWCGDWYRDTYYQYLKILSQLNFENGGSMLVENPQGPDSSCCKVGKGGSWADERKDLRLVYRNRWVPTTKLSNLGFRLAMSITVYDTLNNKLLLGRMRDSIPEGALKGVFSVGVGKKVRFSEGNLQYNPSIDEWRFAQHQYTIIGENNMYARKDYNGWMDLFAWGNSGYKKKKPYFFSYNDFQYGNGEKNIDQTNYEWGYFNAISNGGNRVHLWRTLLVDEWKYLLIERPNAKNLSALAIIDKVYGMLLLPDEWMETGYDTLKAGFVYAMSPEEWYAIERMGAVFLPMAGYVHGQDWYESVPNTSGSAQILNQEMSSLTGTLLMPSSVNTFREQVFMRQGVHVSDRDEYVSDHQMDYSMRRGIYMTDDTEYRLGYYWTPIHMGKDGAMALVNILGYGTFLRAVQRSVRASVRLVVDVNRGE